MSRIGAVKAREKRQQAERAEARRLAESWYDRQATEALEERLKGHGPDWFFLMGTAIWVLLMASGLAWVFQ